MLKYYPYSERARQEAIQNNELFMFYAEQNKINFNLDININEIKKPRLDRSLFYTVESMSEILDLSSSTIRLIFHILERFRSIGIRDISIEGCKYKSLAFPKKNLPQFLKHLPKRYFKKVKV